jgi:multidrug efflux pump subunit AcrB
MSDSGRLGIAGRMAGTFQQARLTPLLALVALLLGVFAVLVTPREEEPQINVTMANVLVRWPGAGVADVEARVAIPVERWLQGMDGVEHVMALSRPEQAVLTVQFKVGVPRESALVRLQEAMSRHAGQLPPGASAPLVLPKGIADVPIVAFTLSGDAALAPGRQPRARWRPSCSACDPRRGHAHARLRRDRQRQGAAS